MRKALQEHIFSLSILLFIFVVFIIIMSNSIDFISKTEQNEKLENADVNEEIISKEVEGEYRLYLISDTNGQKAYLRQNSNEQYLFTALNKENETQNYNPDISKVKVLYEDIKEDEANVKVFNVKNKKEYINDKGEIIKEDIVEKNFYEITIPKDYPIQLYEEEQEEGDDDLLFYVLLIFFSIIATIFLIKEISSI